MNSKQQKIYNRLIECLSPTGCILEDESHKHKGHPGAASGGGHYRLKIISVKFEGQSALKRHQLVYDCLRDFMQLEIHALSITAIAPSEI
jgi:BolA protein